MIYVIQEQHSLLILSWWESCPYRRTEEHHLVSLIDQTQHQVDEGLVPSMRYADIVPGR